MRRGYAAVGQWPVRFLPRRKAQAVMPEPSSDVLVEGDFTLAETRMLLDAATVAIEALTGRKRVARFVFNAQPYRAKLSRYRLSVMTADNKRYVAYRWKD